MPAHTLSAYDTEIRELRTIVSRMGGMTIDQLESAMTALKQLDEAEAKTVLKSDKALDALEIQAETAAIGVFARRAPVADDLREIVAAIKMTMLIERMGDYAKNIAKRTLEIAKFGPIVMPQSLIGMANEAGGMIRDVMDAHAHRNEELAVDVWERDEALDHMYNAAYRQILARMMEMPDQINALSHYLMIAKNLERIGDQTTNVAEQVYYTINGRKLGDERPNGRKLSADS